MKSDLRPLKSMIADKTGLAIRDEDEREFRTVISARLKESGVDEVEAYCRLLEIPSVQSEREWTRLVSQLTVGESYFFRDQDQFELLKRRILPELIAKRRSTRSLRVWSAGCSTGEEAYSVAILIDELLPMRKEWRVTILGTDINEDAVEKAGKGIFGAWSFRRVSNDIKEKYFKHSGEEWHLADRIRQMVEFRVENLLDPESMLLYAGGAMDLILCRNVFIYFNKETISRALEGLAGTLDEGGYLVTGHGELLGQSLAVRGLRVRVHPESVLFRKVRFVQAVGPQIESEPGVRPALPPAPLLSHGRRPVLPARRPMAAADRPTPDTSSTLEGPFRRGQYQAVIESGERLLEEEPGNFKAYSFVARAYANLGQYEKATEMCGKMLEIDGDSAAAYLLLAHIAEAREEYERAKTFLKKVIYLEPEFVAAYVELSGIYDRERDGKRAGLMRRSALELLRSLPDDTVIEPYEEMTAGELVGYLHER